MASPLAISLPPGVVKTDSLLAASGRYTDSDGVRFFKNKPQKIGGNTALTSVALGNPARGMHTWNDLTAQQWLAAGTANKLYAMSNSNYDLVDITPPGFSPGYVDPTYLYGWGAGPWGSGTWGTPRPTTNFLADPMIWSIDNFGKILMAAPADGSLYQWDPTVSPEVPASIVAGSPPVMRGFWQTAELFTIAFGTTGPNGEPQSLMRLYWCAQGLPTDWITTHTQAELAQLPGAPAGSRQLQFGTKIVAGVDIGSFTSLVWTDAALYTHQYTGSSYTFNTLAVGTRCGLISRYGFVVIAGVAFWLSNGTFWMYNGSINRIPNSEDISEWFFGQLRQNFGSKAFAYYNVRFSEVWFVIVPNGETEPSLAAVFNISGEFWFSCTVERTAATNYSAQDQSPILSGADGFIYQHESGLDNGETPLPWTLTTAYLELQEGLVSTDLFGIMPDMERQIGEITVLINALDRTPQPAIDSQTVTFGPTDGLVDLHLSGREIAMTLSCSSLGSDFRMGAPKVELQPGAQRR